MGIESVDLGEVYYTLAVRGLDEAEQKLVQFETRAARLGFTGTASGGSQTSPGGAVVPKVLSSPVSIGGGGAVASTPAHATVTGASAIRSTTAAGDFGRLPTFAQQYLAANPGMAAQFFAANPSFAPPSARVGGQGINQFGGAGGSYGPASPYLYQRAAGPNFQIGANGPYYQYPSAAGPASIGSANGPFYQTSGVAGPLGAAAYGALTPAQRQQMAIQGMTNGATAAFGGAGFNAAFGRAAIGAAAGAAMLAAGGSGIDSTRNQQQQANLSYNQAQALRALSSNLSTGGPAGSAIEGLGGLVGGGPNARLERYGTAVAASLDAAYGLRDARREGRFKDMEFGVGIPQMGENRFGRTAVAARAAYADVSEPANADITFMNSQLASGNLSRDEATAIRAEIGRRSNKVATAAGTLSDTLAQNEFSRRVFRASVIETKGNFAGNTIATRGAASLAAFDEIYGTDRTKYTADQITNRSSIAMSTQMAIGAERNQNAGSVALSRSSVRGNVQAANAEQRFDPIGARLADIETARRNAGIEGMAAARAAVISGNLGAAGAALSGINAANSTAARAVAAVRRDRAVQAQAIGIDQATRGAVLDRLGVYDPVGAEAVQVAGAARSRAQALQASGFTAEAAMELKLGQQTLDVQRNTYLRNFRGQQIDAVNVQLQNPRDVEDPASVLSTMSKARDSLDSAGSLPNVESAPVTNGTFWEGINKIADTVKNLVSGS